MIKNKFIERKSLNYKIDRYFLSHPNNAFINDH